MDTESLHTERPRKVVAVRKGWYDFLVKLCIYKNTFLDKRALQKPGGQTPECEDSGKVSCSSKIKNGDY